MSIMSRIERGALRADRPNDLDDYWYGPAGGQATFAGLPVTPDVATRVSAVWACLDVHGKTLGSLPLGLFRRLANGGKEKALDHPLYPIVARRPNGWQTRFEFVEGLVRNLFLRGNAYAEKDVAGLQLLPRHPDRVKVEQLENTRLRYRITPPTGMAYTRSQDDILHVRDASDDAVTGLARTSLAREAIAVAAAAERFSARWLQNDGSGRVMATHPAKLDPVTRSEVHRVYKENQAGWVNRGSLLLAEGGVKYEVLPSLSESGFLIDPRNFQIKEICRFFGNVPGFMVGVDDRTTWGTNIEQIKSAFVTFCAKPVGDRIEQAMMRDLLDEDEQDEYFIAFDYNELLRGDLLSVVQAIAIERQQGLLSPNEGRAILNRNPRTDPGGDQYQATPTGAAPNNPQRRASDVAPAPAEPAPPDAPDDPAAGAIPAPLLADAVDRIAHAELRELERPAAADAEGPKFAAWAERFEAKHRAYVVKVLTPLAVQFGVEPWMPALAATRLEATALAVLGIAGVPAGWLEQRPGEIAAILDETLRAAAAVRRAA